MDRDKDHRERLALAERAAEWVARMQRADQPPHAAFAAWLRESPRHVEEALFAAAVAEELAGFDRERRIDIQALLAGHAANVVPLSPALPLQQEHHRNWALRTLGLFRGNGAGIERPRHWQRWAAAILFLAVGLAAAGWWRFSGPGSWQSYATALGEQRAIELSDGSLVHLNTQSRITVRLDSDARDIRMLRGEALFKVRHDPRRPFRVRADDTVIQAIGTQFEVYRRSDETRVAVIEGRVRISTPGSAPHESAAGEGANISPVGAIVPQPKLDTVRVTAWRQRRLIFQADTLEDIAAEFNRYNRSPKIRIEDESIRKLRFTGVLDADDPESLGLLLGRDREVSLERQRDRLVLRMKPR